MGLEQIGSALHTRLEHARGYYRTVRQPRVVYPPSGGDVLALPFQDQGGKKFLRMYFLATDGTWHKRSTRDRKLTVGRSLDSTIAIPSTQQAQRVSRHHLEIVGNEVRDMSFHRATRPTRIEPARPLREGERMAYDTWYQIMLGSNGERQTLPLELGYFGIRIDASTIPDPEDSHQTRARLDVLWLTRKKFDNMTGNPLPEEWAKDFGEGRLIQIGANWDECTTGILLPNEELKKRKDMPGPIPEVAYLAVYYKGLLYLRKPSPPTPESEQVTVIG